MWNREKGVKVMRQKNEGQSRGSERERERERDTADTPASFGIVRVERL